MTFASAQCYTAISPVDASTREAAAAPEIRSRDRLLSARARTGPLLRCSISLAVGAALAIAAGAAMAQAKPLAGQVVKIMWIDPLTGLMGPVGNNQLHTQQFLAEHFSAINPAGVKFEVIGVDNKLSPTESLNELKSAIDQGIHYVDPGAMARRSRCR